MTYQILVALPILSLIVLVLGTLIGLINYKNMSGIHKSLYVYIALMLTVDLGSKILWWLCGNNLIVLPFYSLAEMLFFAYLYNKHLLKGKIYSVQNILAGLGVLYILCEILFYFVFNVFDTKQYQPYAKVLDNFIIIIYALSFLYKKMGSLNETRWDNFWLNMVFLVFFTFNTIIFLPFNFLVNESTGLKFYFWSVNSVMLILFYLYLIILIWKNSNLKAQDNYKTGYIK